MYREPKEINNKRLNKVLPPTECMSAEEKLLLNKIRTCYETNESGRKIKCGFLLAGYYSEFIDTEKVENLADMNNRLQTMYFD